MNAKTQIRKMLVGATFVVLGSVAMVPNARALCQGQAESSGCTVDGNGPTTCVAAGHGMHTIVAPIGGCFDVITGSTSCIMSGAAGADNVIIGSNSPDGDVICLGPTGGFQVASANAGNDFVFALSGAVNVEVGGTGDDNLQGGTKKNSLDVLVGGVGLDRASNNGGTAVCAEAEVTSGCTFNFN